MSEAPSVSLIVVNQDRRDELARLVSALRFQRLMPSEIIVVTNLPPSDRPESPLDIRYLPSPERGISAARNTGIAAARGEIVAFCDDDAVPEFGWLEHLIEPFSFRGVAAAGGYVRGRNGVGFQSRTVLIDRYGRDWPQYDQEPDLRIFPPEKDSVPKTVGTNCAFRRAELARIGGFDESFRFYMDEADVNLRLSDAGLQTAIAPLAEVHHGFAASRRRSARRVPTDLFEIGASKAHFCQQNARVADIDTLMPDFIDEQKTRLATLFHFGLVEGGRTGALIARLQQGIADGRTRQRQLADFAPPDGALPPARWRKERRRLLISSRPLRKGAAFARAAEAARDGCEVTVFLVDYTMRPLRVWFDPRGFWVHRIGVFGKDSRDRKAVPGRPEARVQREMRRIEAQRGLSHEGAERVNLR